jgi:hypothetical protein
VRCYYATASSFVAKVRGEVFVHFHAVAVKVTVMCRIDCLACQDEFFVNNPPWCQRKWWACSWLRSSLVSLSSVSVSLEFSCTVHAFFPECLSNHCHGLRCTKFDAVPSSDPSRNRIRPYSTRIQMKGHKNQHVHPTAWNFVNWF